MLVTTALFPLVIAYMLVSRHIPSKWKMGSCSCRCSCWSAHKKRPIDATTVPQWPTWNTLEWSPLPSSPTHRGLPISNSALQCPTLMYRRTASCITDQTFEESFNMKVRDSYGLNHMPPKFLCGGSILTSVSQSVTLFGNKSDCRCN